MCLATRKYVRALDREYLFFSLISLVRKAAAAAPDKGKTGTIRIQGRRTFPSERDER